MWSLYNAFTVHVPFRYVNLLLTELFNKTRITCKSTHSRIELAFYTIENKFMRILRITYYLFQNLQLFYKVEQKSVLNMFIMLSIILKG